ncbi:hypothetical protein AB6834_02610 [Carnobacterium divergens]|uniref:hypothetical protein n=1 Tax=Carnobacterium divergens TaxID=2748 RepID=UPI0039BDCFA9
MYDQQPIEIDLGTLTFKIGNDNLIIWNNEDKCSGEADGHFLSKREALMLVNAIKNFYDQ